MSGSWECVKRDGRVVPFDVDRIRSAVDRCLTAVYGSSQAGVVAGEIAAAVVQALAARELTRPSVEDVQRFVLQQLWGRGLFAAAEAYQNYREVRRQVRNRQAAPVFSPRTAFKPFEYPDAVRFKDAIQRSFWVVQDFDFASDVQDFRIHLTPAERSAAVHALLAISQVEVAVKRFWSRLGDRLPKPEFEQVGIVFGESEVRHADAYSRILDVLDLTESFAAVPRIPALARRVEYLAQAQRWAATGQATDFAYALAVFSLLVENVSLFGQFAVIKSFSRHGGRLQAVDNVVQATMKEEQIHALFGIWLVNVIRRERPEWFDAAFYDRLTQLAREAHAAETDLVDWIFAEGDVPSIGRPALSAFLADRLNAGLVAIGGEPVLPVDPSARSELAWFDAELEVPTDVDFFHKRPTTYALPENSFSADSMW